MLLEVRSVQKLNFKATGRLYGIESYLEVFLNKSGSFKIKEC